MELIKLSDLCPDVSIHGEKILIYRIMNESQESIGFSIHDTRMIKYCNPDETWWMPLPEKPTKKTQIDKQQ